MPHHYHSTPLLRAPRLPPAEEQAVRRAHKACGITSNAREGLVAVLHAIGIPVDEIDPDDMNAALAPARVTTGGGGGGTGAAAPPPLASVRGSIDDRPLSPDAAVRAVAQLRALHTLRAPAVEDSVLADAVEAARSKRLAFGDHHSGASESGPTPTAGHRSLAGTLRGLPPTTPSNFNASRSGEVVAVDVVEPPEDDAAAVVHLLEEFGIAMPDDAAAHVAIDAPLSGDDETPRSNPDFADQHPAASMSIRPPAIDAGTHSAAGSPNAQSRSHATQRLTDMFGSASPKAITRRQRHRGLPEASDDDDDGDDPLDLYHVDSDGSRLQTSTRDGDDAEDGGVGDDGEQQGRSDAQDKSRGRTTSVSGGDDATAGPHGRSGVTFAGSALKAVRVTSHLGVRSRRDHHREDGGLSSAVERDAVADRRALIAMEAPAPVGPNGRRRDRRRSSVLGSPMLQDESLRRASFGGGDILRGSERRSSRVGAQSSVAGFGGGSESEGGLNGTTRTTTRSAAGGRPASEGRPRSVRLKSSAGTNVMVPPGRHRRGSAGDQLEFIGVPETSLRAPRGEGLLSPARLQAFLTQQQRDTEAEVQRIYAKKLATHERRQRRQEEANTVEYSSETRTGRCGALDGKVDDGDVRRAFDVSLMPAAEAQLAAPLVAHPELYTREGDADIYSRRTRRIQQLRDGTTAGPQDHAEPSPQAAGTGPMQRALAALNEADASGKLDTLLQRGWRPFAPGRSATPNINKSSGTCTALGARAQSAQQHPGPAPTTKKQRRRAKKERREVERLTRATSAMRVIDKKQMVLAATCTLNKDPAALARVQQSPLLASAYAGTETIRRRRLALASRGSL